ncbi:hypothetical protein [Tahibacter amnicola]|uniref:Uncharacterized protein n=1 Tax=Tahibacter amnicola TaxID=2976241 RepID=A0ABY6BEG7_9GAMM|nr:hypothetical protein [Tahibacter amnicola]UXI68177.1 hypothetical protein N4264_00550 [Tahibacter amnicola]
MNLANDTLMRVNPLFLRQDLMIEVGRLELAIEDIRSHKSANEAESLVAPLLSRIARLNEALGRLLA